MRAPMCLAALVACAACGGEGDEAARVPVQVVVAEAPLGTATTDLGYAVTVEQARLVVVDLAFTQGGEMHASTVGPLGWLVGVAHAHPGHTAGGEPTGELPGRYVVRWPGGGALGEGVAFVGRYDGADFGFGRAGAGDGVMSDDPLFGHTAHLRGAVEKDGRRWTFQLILDQDDERRVVGAPLPLQVTEGAPPTVAFHLYLVDPIEGDTLFDGVDFAALDADGDGDVTLPAGEAASNRVRRGLQSHEHFGFDERK